MHNTYIEVSSNLTNKYNPQEPLRSDSNVKFRSNLTNKYNPQEQSIPVINEIQSSNLTNKYNPQEPFISGLPSAVVQILPINTILKNKQWRLRYPTIRSNLTNKYNPQERKENKL